MTKIKICGLKRSEDVEYVNKALPDYAGFVFAKSRRQVTPEQAAELTGKLDIGIKPVGVFVDEPVPNVLKILAQGVIDIVQLHGSEDAEYIKALRKGYESTVLLQQEKVSNSKELETNGEGYKLLKEKGNYRNEYGKSANLAKSKLKCNENFVSRSQLIIIKAVKVECVEDIKRAEQLDADFLLLDNGTGGTGMTFDWSIINEARPISKPFFLAGGIGADNAEAAIEAVEPFAVDMSSSVETDGVKDFQKMQEVVEIISNFGL